MSTPASIMDGVRAAAGGQLQLPSVPRVVRRLISQLRDPAASVVDLVDELEQEPQLAARTLRIANSPYYCGRRSLASLQDAVAIIGTNTLRTLVISGGLEAVFVAVAGVNLRQFWLDATITAKAARSRDDVLLNTHWPSTRTFSGASFFSNSHSCRLPWVGRRRLMQLCCCSSCGLRGLPWRAK